MLTRLVVPLLLLLGALGCAAPAGTQTATWTPGGSPVPVAADEPVEFVRAPRQRRRQVRSLALAIRRWTRRGADHISRPPSTRTDYPARVVDPARRGPPILLI